MPVISPLEKSLSAKYKVVVSIGSLSSAGGAISVTKNATKTKPEMKLSVHGKWFPSCCGYIVFTGFSAYRETQTNKKLIEALVGTMEEYINTRKHLGGLYVSIDGSARYTKLNEVLKERGWKLLHTGKNPYHARKLGTGSKLMMWMWQVNGWEDKKTNAELEAISA